MADDIKFTGTSTNVSDVNTDESTDNENQLTVEQQAVLDRHLLALTDPTLAEEFTNDYIRVIKSGGSVATLYEDYFYFLDLEVVYSGKKKASDPNVRQMPVYDEEGNETGQFQDFEGYFVGFPISGILSSPKSENEIIKFQKFLEGQGIVPDGYFDNSIGQYSADLISVVQDIMNWADSNLTIPKGSPEWKAIESKNDFRFFMSQEEEPQYEMERKLFAHAVEKYASETKYLERKEKEQVREAAEQELWQAALEEYPTDDELLTLLENALADSGKKVTPKMLSDASYAFAKKYSKQLQDNIDLIAGFEKSDIWADYIEGTNVKRSDVPIGGYIKTERLLNQDYFKEQITASSFAEDYVEEKYGAEMDAVAIGKKKMEYQQKVLPYVFRYINP